MNKIFVNILHSNLKFIENKKKEIILEKFLGSGSYGCIFLTNINNYVAKIIGQNPYEENDEISDYTEREVVEKIIRDGKDMRINCNEAALGKIIYKEYLDEKKGDIVIRVNPIDKKEPILCTIVRKNKIKTFTVYENNYVIFMPLYVSFYDYMESFSSKKMFKNEKVIFLLINNLIKSVDEFQRIGLINIDIKMNNIMIDNNIKMKIIDFGLTKSIERIDEKIDNSIKYYIWPHKEITYNQLISYMICVFVLEIFFGRRVFELQKNWSEIIDILDNFMKIDNIRKELKNLIKVSLLYGINYIDFKREFLEIVDEINYELPNIYYLTNYNRGINLY